MSQPKRARVRLALARQDAQQRSLAGPVQPHHQQPVVPLDLKRNVAKHQWTPVSLGQTGAVQDDAPAVRRLRKADLHLALPPRRHHALRLHTFDAREDRLRLLGALFSLSPHHLGQQAQPLDLRLLAMRQRRQPLLLEPPGGLVLRVGAAVLDQAAGVEVQDAGDRRVEQAEVVADDDHRAPVIAEEVHEPRLGVGVEVIGRLVEKQQVGLREEHPRKLHPAPLPS